MEIFELVMILVICFIALSYRRDANYYREKCRDISTQYAKQEAELRMLRDKLDEAKGVDIDE
jgi:hypothetical protein